MTHRITPIISQLIALPCASMSTSTSTPHNRTDSLRGKVALVTGAGMHLRCTVMSWLIHVPFQQHTTYTNAIHTLMYTSLTYTHTHIHRVFDTKAVV